ncbi:MAG TPA: hypothetical protein PLH57_02580 [Oligoflexia bacterium]|mgnify:CR=1 FL=1|nr:hypothetical protein [Oligoflexia bacterium]
MKQPKFFYYAFVCAILSIMTNLDHAFGTDQNAESVKSTLQRIGKFEVKQLVSPGFELLPLERKLFAMEIAKVIEAGHDIAWIQANESSLAIREVMHGLWKHREKFESLDRAALAEYLFLLHANHGNYDHRKNKKFVPEGLTLDRALNLSRVADAQNSANGVSSKLEEQMLALEREIFAADYRPAFHADGKGQDIVADSAANFYGPGITKAEIQGLPPEIGGHFLSYPVRGKSGNIELLEHRIGGRFDEYLRLVEHHLKNALQWALPEERPVIEAYRVALRSGDPQDLAKADGLWALYKPRDIDFQFNFIEVYSDPLNSRGEWEGFMILLNQEPAEVARVEKMRRHAAAFEAEMPVDEEFKKQGDFTPPKAEGAYLLYSGGANGERPFAGVNLPNTTINQKIHEQFGSKSYTADNVMADLGEAPKEFSPEQMNVFYAPEYHELLKTVNTKLERTLQVAAHEIWGHGSGRSREGVRDTDLRDYYSALEEGRAEIASLYHMLGTLIRDTDILPQSWSDQQLRDFQTATILIFFTAHLRTYERLAPDAEAIRQAHQWGRQVMMNRLIAEGALEVDSDPALPAPWIRKIDLEKARQALGGLWKQIQRAKSTGDFELAAKLFDTEGGYQEPHRKLRERIAKAIKDLNLPTEKAYLNPGFEAVRDSSGKVTDVKLVYEAPGDHAMERFVDRQVRRATTLREALNCNNLVVE